jgi:UDP-N-acetylmuramoyl-tripeptide--D-alanyl-D-alanine ligase
MQHSHEEPQVVTVEKIVAWSKGSCMMASSRQTQRVTGLSNDSRTIREGEVFIAVSTDKDDGHRYVANALSGGAIAALVSKKKAGMFSDEQKKRLVFVDDPLLAIRRIAHKYRQDLGIPIVGITGSSGKTTARNFIATVLGQTLTVGETRGNWNNTIGVAMSLMRFSGRENVGVLELGANHVGEIHDLSTMVLPTIGVITNIGYAHIGFFGSLENIARAKCEIADGMKEKNGFLMLNGDDRHLVKESGRIKKDIVFFGFSARCHVRARNEKLTSNNTLRFEAGSAAYELSMPGRHYIYSALMAIFLGKHFGIEENRIGRALLSMRPVALRGTVERKSGVEFIVDCYNANPSSMQSAIRLLLDVARKNNKVAIVGDMLELGKYSTRLHAALGTQLAGAGIDRVLAVGDFAKVVAESAINAGMKPGNVQVARNNEEALLIAKQFVRPGDVALIKGSRGVHLETVFEGF